MLACAAAESWQSRVASACRMLKQLLYKCAAGDVCQHDGRRYQGEVGAHLVLGGFDITGPCLYSIAAHGSTDKVPYVTLGRRKCCPARLSRLTGSGSLAAMAVFEDGFKLGMEVRVPVALR